MPITSSGIYFDVNFQFIRNRAVGGDKQVRRRSTIAKKKKKFEKKKLAKNKSPRKTHGRNLFDRAGGKRARGAFEYVDWVVAHKRLLEALWDSAMKARVGEKETGARTCRRARRRRSARESRERTREEPRCSGLARRVEAAGCASATWRGSARH